MKPGPPKRFDHRLQVQIDDEMLARIDQARGSQSRSNWLREAALNRLFKEKSVIDGD